MPGILWAYGWITRLKQLMKHEGKAMNFGAEPKRDPSRGVVKNCGKGGAMIRVNRISGFLWVFLILAVPFSSGDEDDFGDQVGALSGRWSPIVLLPGSTRSAMTRKLFSGVDYEVAIIPSSTSSTGHYLCIEIQKINGSYRCLVKRVNRYDVIKGGVLSPEAIHESEVEVLSSEIDGKSVVILADYLRACVSGAVYHVDSAGPEFRATDAQTYDVYVKGRSQDGYEDYSATVVDHALTSGRSCSIVTSSLAALVLGKNNEPLNLLVAYLESLAEGDSTAIDPFLGSSDPDPEVELPPLK